MGFKKPIIIIIMIIIITIMKVTQPNNGFFLKNLALFKDSFKKGIISTSPTSVGPLWAPGRGLPHAAEAAIGLGFRV